MSANARRGEISAVIDGRDYTLCLTLGALAELESAFAASDLNALVERFAGGRLAAGDLVKIVGAGLRGGGNAISDTDVGAMRVEGGVTGFAEIAVRLLTVTFGTGQDASSSPSGYPRRAEPPLSPLVRGGEGSQTSQNP